MFRSLMKNAGFKIMGNDTVPIAPVYIGDAKIARFHQFNKFSQFSEELFKENIYAIAFSFPVVPKVLHFKLILIQGSSRIRVQLSAAHTEE